MPSYYLVSPNVGITAVYADSIEKARAAVVREVAAHASVDLLPEHELIYWSEAIDATDQLMLFPVPAGGRYTALTEEPHALLSRGD
jgi:hypothetical protein